MWEYKIVKTKAMDAKTEMLNSQNIVLAILVPIN